MLNFVIWVLGREQWWFLFSRAVSFQGDAVRIVDDTIEDSASDGRLADHFVPSCDGKLSSDQRGFATVAFLEDFDQIEALLVIEAVGSPVVDD